MKRIVIIIAAFCACQVYGQQEIMLSQYMFNGLFINPAYAGSHSFSEATALYRSQWTGFEGAPETQTFGIEGPISNEIMGLGLTFVNDQLGDTRQTEVFANYSYKLFLDEEGKTKLSFGLRAGFADYTARLTETKVFDSGDPVFSQNQSNEFVAKFGAGVYISSDLWYAGFSVPTIFATDKNVRFNINDVGDRYFEPHSYLTAGYVFDGGENLKIKPSFLLKYISDAPLQADINCNLLIKNTFWIGASYRSGDAIVGLFELNVGTDFRLGYSYDFTTSELNDYNNGSHEIMLSYSFAKGEIKTKSPRYF
ncbi:MAG: type IX secretion system membrane protein PorP/SprF [Bacteroidetes bacterium]|jgi:type IX secretion system PorP/SprF family membrane protein|nr:type IX secretion system membrane protein PorP/SprF [Bacteroidota bacterium]